MSNNNSTLEETYSFEFESESDQLAKWHNFAKDRDIIYSVTGSISIISSAAIMWHILRSYKGLSSAYHRLVFGLCVGDLITSFAFAVNAAAAPKDLNYLAPFASGNIGTCTAEGFILTVGVMMTSLYNCSICFYYLSIVKFNKKDEYIISALEPWFHGVPVTVALVIGVMGLFMKGFNNMGFGGPCYPSTYHPPHCEGYENGIIPEGFTVPCGRGSDFYSKTSSLLLITPIVIAGTMISMYRTVWKIEKNMQNYGASVLQLRLHQRQVLIQEEEDNNVTNVAIGRDSSTNRASLMLNSLKINLRKTVIRNNPLSRSNSARSQKRAVLYMAMSYSLTWVLTWVPFYLDLPFPGNKATAFIQALLQPLQGFYNLAVYLSPKVRHARNTKRGKLGWGRAIVKAWMSRGEKDRVVGGRKEQKLATNRMIARSMMVASSDTIAPRTRSNQRASL